MSEDGAGAPVGDRTALLVEEPPVSHIHEELFHYTTLTALRGILESNVLWATSAFHLNDSSEMQAFWRHLEGPMRGAFESAIEADADGSLAKAIHLQKLGGIERVAHLQAQGWIATLRDRIFGDAGLSRPFVVSFSTHSGDADIDEDRRRHGMLSQWRGYAAGDGVAIVFDTARLERLLAQEAEARTYWPLALTEAVYDGVIGRLFPLIDKLRAIAPLVIAGRDPEGQVLLQELAEALGTVVARVKHSAFAEEQECRIVAGIDPRLRHLTRSSTPRKERTMSQRILHRRGPTGSIPYLRLFESSNDLLPITRIIVGPSRNQDALYEDVVDAVDGRPIHVQASGIPYVGSV